MCVSFFPPLSSRAPLSLFLFLSISFSLYLSFPFFLFISISISLFLGARASLRPTNGNLVIATTGKKRKLGNKERKLFYTLLLFGFSEKREKERERKSYFVHLLLRISVLSLPSIMPHTFLQTLFSFFYTSFSFLFYPFLFLSLSIWKRYLPSSFLLLDRICNDLCTTRTELSERVYLTFEQVKFFNEN